jgi:hypothetical protein
MQLITLDFETYYDPKLKYSLTSMGTDEYILDERFEVIGVGVKVNAGQTVWMSGTHEQIANWFAGFDWANSAVCCHNTLFDGFILSQIFDIKPKVLLDTLGMGRACLPWLASHSLDNIAKYLGLGKKGHEVITAAGKRRDDFTPSELAAYGGYCCNDVELTYDIAQKLMPIMSPLEITIIDMTLRMFTEPVFVGDHVSMHRMYVGEQQRKEALLAQANVDRETIMSNDKFAAKLRELGVEPPRKLSATTGKTTYAFAKTDKMFTALQEHWDTDVQALVAARLGVKTTIAETRALRFYNMSMRGPLPVYLNYWGAKTTGRMSGGNGTNWQNLSARGPSAGLRNAIMAPPGHEVVVGDSSNIELRVAMAVAGEQDVLDKIASGVDLYCEFASKIYGRTITKADKIERMLGKIAMLSLQYGAGAERFLEMVRIEMAKAGIKSTFTLEESQKVVDLYRNTYAKIPALWRYCERVVLPAIYNQDYMKGVDVNGWALTDDLGFSVPGSPGVVYFGLKQEAEGWEYTMGNTRVNLYGGKVVENLCQYLARMIVMWQTARIHKQFKVALSVHDEAACVVPVERKIECVNYMTECLTMAPPWAKGIPLACEVATGPSYGEAK